MALRLTDFQVILASELDCRLHRLGTTGNQVNAVEITRCVLNQQVGQRFGGVAGEKTGMGKFHSIELGLDRVVDLRIAMAEAGNRGTAGAIEILFTLLVD